MSLQTIPTNVPVRVTLADDTVLESVQLVDNGDDTFTVKTGKRGRPRKLKAGTFTAVAA